MLKRPTSLSYLWWISQIKRTCCNTWSWWLNNSIFHLQDIYREDTCCKIKSPAGERILSSMPSVRRQLITRKAPRAKMPPWLHLFSSLPWQISCQKSCFGLRHTQRWSSQSRNFGMTQRTMHEMFQCSKFFKGDQTFLLHSICIFFIEVFKKDNEKSRGTRVVFLKFWKKVH